MDWLITLLLGVAVILIVYWRAVCRANYWKDRGVPYIKGLPFVGNVLDVVLMRKAFFENVTSLYKQLDGEKYGGAMQFMKPVLVVRDPELINQVLIKDFSHFHDRGLPMDEKVEPLSASLVNLTGDRWRQVRHKLTPTFTSGKMKLMFNQIVECTDNALDYLKDKKEPIEVKKYMQRFNLNVIGMVAFGLKVDALNYRNQKSNTFVEYSTKFFNPSEVTLLKFLMRMSFPKLGKILKLRFMDADTNKFFMNLVKDTVEYRETTNARRNDFIQLMLDLKEHEKLALSNKANGVHDQQIHHKDDHDETEDKELLDQLKNAPIHQESQTPVFTDNCIAAQSFLFISGGSETTATALAFALYELAVNPDVQKRIQKEVDSVLSSHNFDYQTVKHFVYLEQFLYEVMRLHPPGGALARLCTEDFILPGTDKVIEKGVIINIPVMGLHMDPQYFPDPEKCNPDRFEDMDSIPKGVFLPFGGGPRICIAMRLAMLEMKIYLAKLLSKYNLTFSDKTQIPLKMAAKAFTMNVIGGMWVKFEERQQ